MNDRTEKNESDVIMFHMFHISCKSKLTLVYTYQTRSHCLL